MGGRGWLSRSGMTGLAQSTSCQHGPLMCADNFIPPPQTPARFSLGFFFSAWLFFLFLVLLPASQSLGICLLRVGSQLSASRTAEWGGGAV